MKLFLSIFAFGLWIMPSFAHADCYPPKMAQDAVRAIALISDRSQITDLVGGQSSSSPGQQTFRIFANYRYHNYSDKYEVVIDSEKCRVSSFILVDSNLPLQNGDQRPQ